MKVDCIPADSVVGNSAGIAARLLLVEGFAVVETVLRNTRVERCPARRNALFEINLVDSSDMFESLWEHIPAALLLRGFAVLTVRENKSMRTHWD